VAAERGLWTIEEYCTARGENLVRAFLASLDRRDRVDAFALLKLLTERGNTLRLPHSRALGDGLFELRGEQVRLFYMFRPRRRITLLDGMIKKRDTIPAAVLQRVRGYQATVQAMDEAVRGSRGRQGRR
jgi:hypothetical protein